MQDFSEYEEHRVLSNYIEIKEELGRVQVRSNVEESEVARKNLETRIKELTVQKESLEDDLIAIEFKSYSINARNSFIQQIDYWILALEGRSIHEPVSKSQSTSFPKKLLVEILDAMWGAIIDQVPSIEEPYPMTAGDLEDATSPTPIITILNSTKDKLLELDKVNYIRLLNIFDDLNQKLSDLFPDS